MCQEHDCFRRLRLLRLRAAASASFDAAGTPESTCRGIQPAPLFVHKPRPTQARTGNPDVTLREETHMTRRKEGQGMLRTVVRIAIVAAGLASLGACASIPQRAWAN